MDTVWFVILCDHELHVQFPNHNSVKLIDGHAIAAHMQYSHRSMGARIDFRKGVGASPKRPPPWEKSSRKATTS